MGTRITLTKNLARELLEFRKKQGMSQYELAEKLGWVRSKIKRLEKGEVTSISVADVEELKNKTGWRGFSGSSSPSSSAPRGTKKPKGSSFKVLEEMSREKTKLKYFHVEFRHPTAIRDLFGLRVTLDGVSGAIHGVEHTSKQGELFQKGDQTVIAIYPK